MFRREQTGLIVPSSRIYQWWLAREQKHNGLKVPSDLQSTYWRHDWLMPQWPYLNPSQEVKADMDAIESKLKTHAEVIGGRGGDWRATYRQLRREEQFAESIGLVSAKKATEPIGANVE